MILPHKENHYNLGCCRYIIFYYFFVSFLLFVFTTYYFLCLVWNAWRAVEQEMKWIKCLLFGVWQKYLILRDFISRAKWIAWIFLCFVLFEMAQWSLCDGTQIYRLMNLRKHLCVCLKLYKIFLFQFKMLYVLFYMKVKFLKKDNFSTKKSTFQWIKCEILLGLPDGIIIHIFRLSSDFLIFLFTYFFTLYSYNFLSFDDFFVRVRLMLEWLWIKWKRYVMKN